MTARACVIVALLCCLYFAGMGLVFLPYTGAQYDEVLFGSAIYPPISVEYAIETRFGRVPIMLMSYLGALKAWVYKPILMVAGPSRMVLRVPTLLAAAVAIWLFFLAARRLIGPWPALFGTALLATDVNYLLTSLYDWGPVAMQHLLFACALYGAVRFVQEPREGVRWRWLSLASFAIGLALWDKAVVIWLAGGLGLALLLVFPKELARIVLRPWLAIPAIAALLAGAAPLLKYNVVNPMKTLTAGVHVTSAEYPGKVRLLDMALAGDGLFGYISREQSPATPVALRSWESAVVRLNDWLGRPRHSLQQALTVLSLLAIPALLFGPHGRLALWIGMGAAITCFVMFSTGNAGGSVHHIVLLWPLPQLLIALTAAEGIRVLPTRFRKLPAALVLLAVFTNLAVANSLLADLARNGSSVIWSDAMGNLIRVAGNRPGHELIATEWGILEQVRFFSKGRISFLPGSDGWAQHPEDPYCAGALGRALDNPATLFIGHANGSEIFPGINDTLNRFAAARGFNKQVLETISDRHGRAIFEIFVFRKS
jgi:hypothetical protein